MVYAVAVVAFVVLSLLLFLCNILPLCLYRGFVRIDFLSKVSPNFRYMVLYFFPYPCFRLYKSYFGRSYLLLSYDIKIFASVWENLRI